MCSVLQQVLLGRLHKEDCAVKTILKDSQGGQARFLKELNLLRTVHTQHITRCMGWSVCSEGYILLMEYMPGILSVVPILGPLAKPNCRQERKTVGKHIMAVQASEDGGA